MYLFGTVCIPTGVFIGMCAVCGSVILIIIREMITDKKVGK